MNFIKIGFLRQNKNNKINEKNIKEQYLRIIFQKIKEQEYFFEK